MFTANLGPKASMSKASHHSLTTARQLEKVTRSLEFVAIALTTDHFGTDQRRLKQFWILRSIYGVELLFQALIKSMQNSWEQLYLPGLRVNRGNQSLTPLASFFRLTRDGTWPAALKSIILRGQMDKTRLNISSGLDKYSKPSCPENMWKYCVLHNGYEHQRLVRAAKGKTVWMNIAPFLPLIKQKRLERT